VITSRVSCWLVEDEDNQRSGRNIVFMSEKNIVRSVKSSTPGNKLQTPENKSKNESHLHVVQFYGDSPQSVLQRELVYAKMDEGVDFWGYTNCNEKSCACDFFQLKPDAVEVCLECGHLNTQHTIILYDEVVPVEE
jgi:hypothetical protein